MPTLTSPLVVPVPEALAAHAIALRRMRLADAGALWDATTETRRDPGRWIPWADAIRTPEEAGEFIARDRARWELREALRWGIWSGAGAGESLAGAVGFSQIDWRVHAFGFWYWLRPSAEGRGLMREAVRVLTRTAFAPLGANRVEIRVDPANVRGRRIPEALGFVLEGTHRRDRRGPVGELTDTHVFALLPEEYRARPWAEVGQGEHARG